MEGYLGIVGFERQKQMDRVSCQNTSEHSGFEHRRLWGNRRGLLEESMSSSARHWFGSMSNMERRWIVLLAKHWSEISGRQGEWV